MSVDFSVAGGNVAMTMTTTTGGSVVVSTAITSVTSADSQTTPEGVIHVGDRFVFTLGRALSTGEAGARATASTGGAAAERTGFGSCTFGLIGWVGFVVIVGMCGWCF